MTGSGGIQYGIDRAGRYFAIALGFTLPVSVALDNALLLLVLLAYLFSGRYREKAAAIARNPVLIAALLLFAALALAATYGPAGAREAGRTLSKYADLLCVPAFAWFLADPAARRHALHAFAAAIAATVLFSFAFALGALPQDLFKPNSIWPVAFKHNLTQSLLVAIGAFLFALLALDAASARRRAVYATLAVLALVNVTFVVPSRTAWLAVAALALYAAHALWGPRSLLWAVPAAVLAAAVAFGTSDRVRERVESALQEYRSAAPASAAWEGHSIGLRLEFWRNTLAIVREHPLTGVGTGGFPKAYAERISPGMMPVANPHNEYLLLMAQAGLVGLLLLLHLLWRQWRLAPRLARPLECRLARGLVLAFALGLLFNSFLLDHTEGLLFAWLTGLLYAGLQSRQDGSSTRETAPLRPAPPSHDPQVTSHPPP